MTDHNHDAPADHDLNGDADTEMEVLWKELADGLGCYLSAMNISSMHSLVIELVGPEPQTDPAVQDLYPYVILLSRSDGLLHAEIPSNLTLHPRYALGEGACNFLRATGWDEGEVDWYLDFPIEDAEEVADRVVIAFREHFRVAHPHLFTFRVWGDAGPDGGLLGLCGTKDVPLDQPMEAPAGGTGRPVLQDQKKSLAVEPDDRDHLLQIIGRLLREKYDRDPTVDDDGDFVLHHLGQPVWVCAHLNQAAVEIMARVAHGVHFRRAAAVEIGLLNRDNPWVRWTLREGDIWQTVLLPGNPFVPSHLGTLLDQFHNAMSATRDDLVYRTGARVA